MKHHRVIFPATLLTTMTASAYQIFVFAVLASPLIDDLDMSRAQLGLIGSINTLVGATTAPFTGRLTDRIGARRSIVAVLVLSALGMAIMAVAPDLWWLSVSAGVGGIPQGWGNPATNALISTRVDVGRRGSLMGVKQSGVTLGIFLSGATMPAIAAAASWRVSVLVYAIVFAAVAVIVELTLGADPADASPEGSVTPDAAPGHEGSRRPALDPVIRRMALYALLMGTAGGAVGRFFPLFAEESIGFTTEAAGLLVAIGGLLGMGARVVAGKWAEHRIAPIRLLGLLAIVGAAYCALLGVVTESSKWLLLLSPPLSAVGIAAWNAVAMLAIITFVAGSEAGRASGIVMLGFLGGLSISAPLAGYAVDQWGQYRTVWLVAAALAALAAALMLVGRSEPGRDQVHPPDPIEP
jgi:predicted MFS family arabinose efflux permease